MRLVVPAADAPLMQDRTFPAVLHRFDRHLDVLGRADSTRRKYRYELLCWWVVAGTDERVRAALPTP